MILCVECLLGRKVQAGSVKGSNGTLRVLQNTNEFSYSITDWFYNIVT